MIRLMLEDAINVPGAPDVAGLTFRHFRGEGDFPAMAEIVNAYAAANGDDWVETADRLAVEYAHLVNCDTATDMLIGEVDGQMIGYWRAEWWDETDGPLTYVINSFLHPAWRGLGISRPAQDWMEDRMRQVAAGHDPDRPKYFRSFASHGNHHLRGLLESTGYEPIRHFHLMVRPSLDDIPDFPLPAGLELRPVRADQYRAIWKASNEAFRDHWGFGQPTEEEYAFWLESMYFQPDLWQVAWDREANVVAGQVRTFIDHDENEKHGRLRGYTEFISVGRPYRRRGLARALIVRSLRAQKDAGMTESALNVDSENLSGASRVYEDCGFRVVRTGTSYQKRL
jgi:GNAT superfamily N-acetyltransferase